MNSPVTQGKVSRPRPEADLDLSSVYARSGKERELSFLDGRPRHEILRLIIGASVFLLLIAGAGFAFFRSPDSVGGPGEISLSIESPASIPLGRKGEIKVNLTNRYPVAVENLQVEILPPVGWHSSTTLPETPHEEGYPLWNFERLEAGETQQILITGWLLQSLPFTGTWKLQGSYIPTNFRSEFPLFAEWNMGVDEPVWSFTWENKENPVLTLTTSEPEFPPFLQVRLKWPPGSRQPRYEPNPNDPSGPFWRVPEKVAQFSVSLGSRPTFAPDGVLLAPQAEVWYQNPNPAKGQLKLISRTWTVDGVADNVEKKDVILTINDIQNPQGIDWGSKTSWVAKISNSGDSTLKNLTVRFFIRSDVLDSVSLLTNDKPIKLSYDSLGGFVTITEKEFPQLKTLQSGAEITIPFQVTLRAFNQLQKPSLDVAYGVSGSIQVQGVVQDATTLPQIQPKSETKVFASDPVRIPLNGAWSGKIGLRYFTDDKLPLGSGPMPFQENTSTVLALQGVINNMTSDIRDIRISWKLPLTTTFSQADPLSSGVWTWDSSSRLMTWTLSQLPAADTLAGREARFSAFITVNSPATTEPLEIIPASEVRAVDIRTGQTIQLPLIALRSSMDFDPFAKYKGNITASNPEPLQSPSTVTE